jgi:subtilisin-like proprotein convertase family protein
MRLVATPFLLFALAFAPEASGQSYASSDTPLPVADGAPGGSTCGDPGDATVSTITVPAGSGTVSDLNVLLDISATWVGDVTVTLSNGSTTVVLVDRPGTDTETGCGDSSDDYPGIVVDDEGADGTVESAPSDAPTSSDIAYTEGGSYTPNEPLSGFDGAPLAGTWTLTVTDGGEGDDTVLNGWQLLFNDAPPVNAEAGAMPSGYAFDLAGQNPFAASTRFDLVVAETQPVRVAAYDLRGREVAVLHDGLVLAGSPLAVAFARGDLQAGAYVVRALGDRFTAVQRVVMVR